MNTELRERVARAIAREFAIEAVWDSFRAEADAVLAELAPELHPQAAPSPESVFEDVTRTMQSWVAPQAEPAAKADKSSAAPAIHKFLDRMNAEVAPQPQADDDDALGKFQDACIRAGIEGPQYTKLRRELGYIPRPQPQARPQASAEDLAAVDAAMNYLDAPNKRAAWQRIRASLGVGK
jgi:hypothetical protein